MRGEFEEFGTSRTTRRARVRVKIPRNFHAPIAANHSCRRDLRLCALISKHLAAHYQLQLSTPRAGQTQGTLILKILQSPLYLFLLQFLISKMHCTTRSSIFVDIKRANSLDPNCRPSRGLISSEPFRVQGSH